ncbi:MAG: hypothetical protein AAFR42_02820 [Cyanobacteria bacterium J06628_6]
MVRSSQGTVSDSRAKAGGEAAFTSTANVSDRTRTTQEQQTESAPLGRCD